jgi:hypothetical protein
MIKKTITNIVNILYYELFNDKSNPVIGIVSRGISGELYDIMLWRPMVNNMRNFHQHLEYGDLFDV